MKLFNDFQSYQLNFSSCHLDYFKLITADTYQFVQFREALILVQYQSAYCQIVVRFGRSSPNISLTFSISRRADKTYSSSSIFLQI